VLVVDDRPINRQIVQYQLSAKGMEVDEADNGIIALNAMQAAAEAGKPYDVALLDMKMPKIDGSTLGRLILSEPDWAQTKLVLMTSIHAGDSAQPLLKSGFSDYLVKPVKESQLVESLLKVLASAEEPSLVTNTLSSGKEEANTAPGQPISLKILLVEDTPINLKLVRHQVQLLGHTSEAAENGQEALDKLASHDYDIVLMDCQMPIMDGYTATRALRKREGADRHTVIVGMTAYAMQGDREKCLKAGMDDYLSKPVMVKNLAPVLQRWASVVKRSQEETSQSENSSHIDLDPSVDVVDWVRLKEISEGDSAFQLELVQEFIKEVATFITQAKQALIDQDWNTIANIAHQIKGGSSSVAVQVMPEVARQLRNEALVKNQDSAAQLIAQLEQILERLKGHMDVNPILGNDSRSPKNLAIEEALPIVSKAFLGDEGGKSNRPQETSLKILLVEDTPINLKLVQHQVRLLGHQWESAENGQLALEKLSENDYDIVLMDCQMPVMDGYQATQFLRRREGSSAHTVVIGMTAFAMPGDREKCLEVGMDDYLSKPVMVKDLKVMLEQWASVVKGELPKQKSSESPTIIDPALDPVDWVRLKEISAGDPGFQLELVQGFIKEAATFINQAKEALEVKDWVTLANKAHQIKGASASVAVQSMARIAANLYNQARDNEPEGTPELITQLEQILGRLKGHIDINSISVEDLRSTKEPSLELPSSDMTPQSSKKQLSNSERGQGASLNILLVEDTPINLKLVRHQVHLLGHQSDAAENGQEALDKLAQGEYDIVLMDCQMPVMDGYQATQLLRRREGSNHHIVVIGMTAYAMQGDREKCLEAGMDDYLSKPVMIKDLKVMLERWSFVVKRDSHKQKSKSEDQTSIAPASDPVDWTHLQEISMADPAFQLELVKGFVKDGKSFLSEAKQALAAQDWITLANKAHQIKGASASVAVQSMSEIALNLDERAKDQNLEGASKLVAQLEQILEQVEASVYGYEQACNSVQS
jgi:CheY-like chemotaxis protein